METPPQKRYAHSACMIGSEMFIFGGLNSPNKGGNLQTFYQCSLALNPAQGIDGLLPTPPLYKWDKIKAEAPRARDSHTCVPF